MKLFEDANIDWLGLRWRFITIASILVFLSVVLYFVRGGFVFGIEFTGGTVAYIKFQEPPDLGKIRDGLQGSLPGTPLIQRFDAQTEHKIQVKTEPFGEGEEAIGQQARAIKDALAAEFNTGLAAGDKLDLNDGDLGIKVFRSQLVSLDPLDVASTQTLAEQSETYQRLASGILNLRKEQGLFLNFDELEGLEGVTDRVLVGLKGKYYLGRFTIQGVQSIGAVVGRDLRQRAQTAVGLSLIGMLAYIAFRFKRWSYGIGAVVALLYDVIVTLGAFLLTNKEISLTVVASVLTIVGYSVNDTIVIFDRVRENLRLMRREGLMQIMNASINQTLGRTVLTSGFTFLAVISIYLFGGDVLDGFAFALVIGVVSGTFSTVAIAGPLVLIWHELFEQREERRRA